MEFSYSLYNVVYPLIVYPFLRDYSFEFAHIIFCVNDETEGDFRLLAIKIR